MNILATPISSLSGISALFTYTSAGCALLAAVYLTRREPDPSQRFWIGTWCVLGWVVANLIAFPVFEHVVLPDEILLLREGLPTSGMVERVYYRRGMDEGWTIEYIIRIRGRSFHGEASGPKKYFAKLHSGTKIAIIYLPANPAINLETFDFRENPLYQNTFRTYQLYDEFLLKYGAPTQGYSYDTWLTEQRME